MPNKPLTILELDISLAIAEDDSALARGPPPNTPHLSFPSPDYQIPDVAASRRQAGRSRHVDARRHLREQLSEWPACEQCRPAHAKQVPPLASWSRVGVKGKSCCSARISVLQPRAPATEPRNLKIAQSGWERVQTVFWPAGERVSQ